MLLLLTDIRAVINGPAPRMPGPIRHAPQEQTKGPEDMAHMLGRIVPGAGTVKLGVAR